MGTMRRHDDEFNTRIGLRKNARNCLFQQRVANGSRQYAHQRNVLGKCCKAALVTKKRIQHRHDRKPAHLGHGQGTGSPLLLEPGAPEGGRENDRAP